MTPTSVLLFSAGLGTRMAPLTDTRPKPLVEVAGRTLLDHARAQCGDEKQVVNVHYRADQIRAHLSGADVAISDETDALLETGGGLKRALPLLDSNPTYTLNTDAVWAGPPALEVLHASWNPDEMDALLLLVPSDRAVGHAGKGDFDLETDGSLIRGQSTVYTGAQIIKTDALAHIEEPAFSMWSLWTPMLEAGRMYGTIYPGRWCDVGRPDCIPLAEAMLEEGGDV